MTEPIDLTVQVLRQIRDEIVSTRTELSSRIDTMRDELGTRIDAMRDDLGSRIDVTNVRVDKVEHALLDLAEQQRFVVRHLQALTTRDRRLEDEVGDLRGRLEVVEKKLGVG